jgi:hypothetical protein
VVVTGGDIKLTIFTPANECVIVTGPERDGMVRRHTQLNLPANVIYYLFIVFPTPFGDHVEGDVHHCLEYPIVR